jgi:hypothetical protein
MISQYNLFPDDWNNRNDFPIELDIKYTLLSIRSRVYASNEIHPVLRSLGGTIVRNERRIINKCLTTIHKDPNIEVKYAVNLHVFEAHIPAIVNYIKECISNSSLDSLTNLSFFEFSVPLRDAVFYIWEHQLPDGLWLPLFFQHEGIKKYHDLFESELE